MELESVRGLKAELEVSLSRSLRPSRQQFRSLGVAARSSGEVDRVQRTFALGIHPAGREYRLAVRIQSRSYESGPHLDQIVRRSRGEIDVRYVGRVTKRLPGQAEKGAASSHGGSAGYRTRERPLQIGYSIGHFAITAGTLGCFVKLRSGSRPMILSNNHVLADENRARLGDAVLQPGTFDGGRPKYDRVGSLKKFIEMRQGRRNKVDAALSDVDESIEFEAYKLPGGKALEGLSREPPGAAEQVEKYGRTTGHTHGRVTAFELDNVIVAYDTGNLRFDDQIEIEGAGDAAFSAGGDSGSMIFTSADRLAMGLLFAGGDQGGSNGKGLTFANPMPTVLDQLKCELW